MIRPRSLPARARSTRTRVLPLTEMRFWTSYPSRDLARRDVHRLATGRRQQLLYSERGKPAEVSAGKCPQGQQPRRQISLARSFWYSASVIEPFAFSSSSFRISSAALKPTMFRISSRAFVA